MSSVAHYANHVYMYEVRLKLEFYQAGPETVMSMWVCMQCTGCIILVLKIFQACLHVIIFIRSKFCLASLLIETLDFMNVSSKILNFINIRQAVWFL